MSKIYTDRAALLDGQKRSIVTRKDDCLAIEVGLVASLLNLGLDYDSHTIAALIRSSTENIEWQNGYALINKTIEVTHTNATIVLPQMPIHKIISIEQKDLRTGIVREIGPEHYLCATNGKYGYVQISHTAFTTEELQLLGLTEGEDNKYHKARIVFTVKYEAGYPSSGAPIIDGFRVSERVPEVFKGAIVKEIAQLLRTCTKPANTLISDEPRLFVGKI